MKTLFLLLGLTVWTAHSAEAQSSCASDGQTTPVTLVERFISADCEACWSESPRRPPAAGALTLDWIVPGKQGEDAPLSAAASRDALMRLEALGRAAPVTSAATSGLVTGGRANRLRVAHGLPLGGYIGTSIELKTALQPRGQAGLSAWLVLVETIPAGTDGTATPRNLVRNVLQLPWNKRNQLSKTEHLAFYETRPLSIPSGATPERLRVVGWVQDGRGRILTAAQSVCAPPDGLGR
jgi:hypothetical protein